jgi:ATP:ADP antiporter, AAA family
LIAAIFGSAFGFTAASASFAFFFLLIVLSKLFAKSLKDSIEVPASKILYQSLDVSVRYDVQARIDGTVNELAAFSSGLILAGLGMISFVKIIHFSYFLILILLIWVYIGYRLYISYRLSLESSLKKFQHLTIDQETELPLLEKIIPGVSDSSEVAAVLEFAPQSWNGYVSRNIPKLITYNQKILTLILRIIENLDLKDTVDQLDQISGITTPVQKSRLKIMMDRFRTDGRKSGEEELRKMLKSENPDDRKKGLIIILEKNDPKYFPRIVPLFRDPSSSVRISAIHTAGILNRKDFVTYLVDMLEDPEYYSYAFNALCLMNEDILENLEHGFHKTGIGEKGMVRITRVIGSIGTPKAARYLIGKLNHYNRNVFLYAVKGLQKINFDSTESDKIKIFTALNRVAGITAWNLSAKYSLRESDMTAPVVKAIDEEILENYDLIYSLLSIAYDQATVYHIRKNLESGTSEGIGFAIELLDMFIDETVKPYLFPLLDDTSTAEKVKLLQSEFPVEIMKTEEQLLAIINRDYNQINPYTRVCAIQALQKMESFRPGKDIIAQMFNPDPLLREESSKLLFRLEKESFNEVQKRLSPQYRLSIENFLPTSGTDEERGFFRKFRYLRESELFINFNNHQLLYIARRFELYNFDIIADEPFSQLVKPGQIIFIAEGELKIRSGEDLISFRSGKLIDIKECVDLSFEEIVIAGGSSSRVLLLDKSALQELIFDDENSFFSLAEMLYPVKLD